MINHTRQQATLNIFGISYLPATSARHVSYRPFTVESEVNWSPVWRQSQFRRNVFLVTLVVARTLGCGATDIKLLPDFQVFIPGYVFYTPSRGTVRIAVVSSKSGIRCSIEIAMEIDFLP
jgi:hypothetical protein